VGAGPDGPGGGSVVIAVAGGSVVDGAGAFSRTM